MLEPPLKQAGAARESRSSVAIELKSATMHDMSRTETSMNRFKFRMFPPGFFNHKNVK